MLFRNRHHGKLRLLKKRKIHQIRMRPNAGQADMALQFFNGHEINDDPSLIRCGWILVGFFCHLGDADYLWNLPES